MTLGLLILALAAGAAFAQPAVTERDIDYTGTGRPDQMLDLDVPEGPGPFPLLIHVHGGGWRNGEKGKGAGVAVARPRMGARGYAFATINYRLSGTANFPAQIQDCKAAVRWLRANAAQYQLDPERFAVELDRAVQALSPLASKPVIGHRAPYFSVDDHSLWALEVLRERGFRYDSSFFPMRSMLYGYPGAPRFPFRVGNRGELVEFPVSTARWLGVTWPMGGGFYVRALPYGLIRAGIRQLNRQGQPAILYMHPWELDTEQGYWQLTLRERVSHYYGRQGLEKKLRRLFGELTFSPLRELVDGVV